MSRNLYDVTDVRTDKVLFTGLSRNEVQDKIGLSAKHVYLYAQNYSIYKGIYQISARGEDRRNDYTVPVCDAEINRVYRTWSCRDTGEPYPELSRAR